MSATCQSCNHEVQRYVTKFHASGAITTTCHTCEHPVHSSTVGAIPSDGLVLDHVLDESGKPVRVTSLRQLREAETRYHFRSLIGHTDEANFDKPPQQPTGTIADFMTREKKWAYEDTALRMLKDPAILADLARSGDGRVPEITSRR